jgi:hypothetical protein
MEWTRKDTVGVYSWGAGVKPERDRRMFGVAPVAAVPKNLVVSAAQREAFCDPRFEAFTLPEPPITIGSQTRMVVLRKAIADGTARPGDIADFEPPLEGASDVRAGLRDHRPEALVAARADKLHIMGMWNALYMVAKLRRWRLQRHRLPPRQQPVRRGRPGRAQLPTGPTGVRVRHVQHPEHPPLPELQHAGAQLGHAQCGAGNRYHVPPWIIPMVLNEEGDELLPHTRPERSRVRRVVDLAPTAAGGVITGDKISLDYGPCLATRARASVTTSPGYADLKGDDKIGCAGTVDAYVRGLS